MVEEAKIGARLRVPGGRATAGDVPQPEQGPRGRARITVSPNAGEGDRNEARTALMLATRTRSKAAGLLLSGPSDKALLLVSCNDVHTVGMRHAIDVAFVDRLGRVVEAHRSVGPLRRLRNAKAVAVVERFASCDSPWFAKGDQVVISGGREVSR